MFSNTFPLAPIFSFFTNLLEIKIKLDGMVNFSQRFTPEGASGIGGWLSIMEFLVLLGIPINCMIMFFTGQNTWVEESKDEYKYHSSLR